MSGRSARDSTPTAIATLRALTARGTPASLAVLGEGDRHCWPESGRLPIRFLGHLDDRSLIAETLSDADVTLAPNRREAFGLAALEAMACGTPVVVPVDSGSAELVTGGTGICVPAGPRGFASAALEVYGLAGVRPSGRGASPGGGLPVEADGRPPPRRLFEYSRLGMDGSPLSPPVDSSPGETTVPR